MSAVSQKKRRKLNASTAQSPLSAFAARKAQKDSIVQEAETEDYIPLEEKSGVQTPVPAKVVAGIFKTKEGLVQPDFRATSDLDKTALIPGLESDISASFGSRAQSPEPLPLERPSITLSNFTPDKENVRALQDGSIALRLSPGERLVILGQYEISIRKGQVTLMGATLCPSKTFYPVFASSSHALPVVRCSADGIEGADLRLRSCENGLRSLSALSPLYGRIWNDHAGPLGPDYARVSQFSMKSSFQILFSSRDGPAKTFLQPLISPPLWNEMFAKCSTTPTEAIPRIVMICGPKSSGKSTFAKLLVNRLLSVPNETGKTVTNSGVAVLDIDPGQPEYCPPGQLALVHIHEPNFGPPFAHPVPGPESKILRQHSIGAISPAMDPDLFMACLLDLFAHYKNLLSKCPDCSLVINTPGWVLGTGLEILVGLVAKIKPTEIIYMSKDGPPEVVENLSEASSVQVVTLPSQTSEYATRTAAHLRTMQYMSYFHLEPTLQKGLSWNTQPLTSTPPWEIRYAGENPGISGVLCYGEQPPASLVAHTLNGSIVSVVVIDDMAAIPGWGSEQSTSLPSTFNTNPTNLEIDEHSPQLQYPLVLPTLEGIPYFNPMNAITLDPSHSHSIGLALVRGIDTTRRRIQILTPISPKIVEKINASTKKIVLVSGKLDTPGWAYIEELTQKMALDKAKKGEVDVIDGEEGSDASDEEDGVNEQESGKRILGDGFGDAPWVEKLEGSQGRGIGSRVWRVRRDLGKADD